VAGRTGTEVAAAGKRVEPFPRNGLSEGGMALGITCCLLRVIRHRPLSHVIGEGSAVSRIATVRDLPPGCGRGSTGGGDGQPR
jgi:hypothetical protein